MTRQISIDEKTLVAFLDGELDPARAAQVEAVVATDPILGARLAQHRALSLRLGAAFDPVLSEPVPQSLLRAARAPTEVTDLRVFRNQRQAWGRPLWRGSRVLGLLAAGLLGAVIVSQALLAPPPAPFAEHGGRLIASGPLAHALNQQLASAGPISGVRIQLTFRDHQGAICRTFQSTGAAGLACRENDGVWAMRAAFGGEASASGAGYRMASGGDPRLMQVVGDMIVGGPFDAAEERHAKALGWKAPSAGN